MMGKVQLMPSEQEAPLGSEQPPPQVPKYPRLPPPPQPLLWGLLV